MGGSGRDCARSVLVRVCACLRSCSFRSCTRVRVRVHVHVSVRVRVRVRVHMHVRVCARVCMCVHVCVWGGVGAHAGLRLARACFCSNDSLCVGVRAFVCREQGVM